MASKPPPNPYIAGPPIGSQAGFFGREEIFQEVERSLHQAKHNSVILHGQRRIGKSSLLLQLERRLPSPPFFTVYFDLADKALWPIGQVLHALAATAADIADMSAPAPRDFEDNPAAFDKRFLPALSQALGSQRRPLFLLDEFGVLDTPEEELEPTAAVRGLDDYLYNLLQKQGYTSFIFAAGRRMEEISSVVKSGFKADLTRFVSVLTPEQARTLILQPGVAGIPSYDEPAIEQILALTRGHPYLTQRICHTLFERAHRLSPRKPRVTTKDVDVVVHDLLGTEDESISLIWGSLPSAERITLAAMAERVTGENEIFGEGNIRDALREAGISPEAPGLEQTPENLIRWQMFEPFAGGYRFFIKLIQRWISFTHPLEQIKIEELVHLDPAAQVLYQAARQSYEEENNKLAIAPLYQVLSVNPGHLPARMLLGTILKEEEQLAEAVVQYEEAYKLDQSVALAPLGTTLLLLGAALEDAGNYPDALAAYDRALAISPDNKSAKSQQRAVRQKSGQASKVQLIPLAKADKEQPEPPEERHPALRAAFIIVAILIPLGCLLFLRSGYSPFGTNQAGPAPAVTAEKSVVPDAATTNSAIAAAPTATREAGQVTPTSTVEPSATPTTEVQTATPDMAATAAAETEATELPTTVIPPSGQIRVVGSNEVQLVIEALAQAFTEQYPEVEISVQASGSGAGIESLQQELADIGMVARNLEEAELVELGELQQFTLAENDVIAVITHVLVPVDNLSTDQLRAIYTGEITNWNQVGGVDAPIVVVTGDETSDTRTVFEQLLSGGADGFNLIEAVIEGPSDQARRNIVAARPYAIGYTSLRLTGLDPDMPTDSQNWAVLDTAWLEVNVLALDQIEPSLENTSSGAYPLTRPLSILVQEQPGELVQRWLDFIFSAEGQEIIEILGHRPVP